MARVAPVILAVALWIYGLIDCAQTPPEKMPKGLSKPVWLLIVLLVPAIGALAWLVVKGLAATSGGQVGLRRKPKRPTAPDEDPEFLANLDWQARKAYYERQKKEREAAAAAGSESADPVETPLGDEAFGESASSDGSETASLEDSGDGPSDSAGLRPTDATGPTANEPPDDDPFAHWEQDLTNDDPHKD